MPENPNSAVTLQKIQQGGLACWQIITPYATALIAEQGAQVLQYHPVDGKPVIWLSDQAAYRASESVRGGIPVCWPWFGDLGANPPAVRDCAGQADGPKHGWARTIDWTLSKSDARDGAAILVFTLDTQAAGLPWRHHAVIALTIEVGRNALTLTLATRNAGSEPLHLTQALHGYFAVSDSRSIGLSGFAGKRYIDTVGGWTEKRQVGDISITAETDRIYLGVGPLLTLDDPGWNRRIRVELLDSESCVVWNPWVEKSLQLSQFAPSAWQDMVCIEAARVLDDLMVVEPGRTAAMGVRISSVSLTDAARSVSPSEAPGPAGRHTG